MVLSPAKINYMKALLDEVANKLLVPTTECDEKSPLLRFDQRLDRLSYS